MTLIQLLGDVGSGKTLLATAFALYEKRPVYANYKIKIPNYHEMRPEILAKLNIPSLAILDEAYAWIESRRSGKPINTFMSYILFQSRKREIDFILTDQLLGTIDVRFRQMTNYEIHCRHIVDIGFQYTFYKLSGFTTYQPTTYIMPYSVAEKIYPLYDSWELINPIDDEMIFNITQDKGEIIKEVDEVVNYLLNQASAKEYRKGDIADYCLRHGYPKTHVDLIYNAIKATRFKPRKVS